MSTLKEIREERGLSRAQVAAKIDMSERHLYRLENGQSPVRRIHLAALADVYEIPVEELIRRAA